MSLGGGKKKVVKPRKLPPLTKKEYKDCTFCGEKVVAPHDYGFHFSCRAIEMHITD
jgi:hypothetical protein